MRTSLAVVAITALAITALAITALAPTAAAQPAAAQPAGQPAGRKRSGGDALEVKAVEEFVEAVLADRAGDYRQAITKYERTNRISPHANTYFNIADLYRRTEQYEEAIEHYRKYLELAPKAPDRANVERLIAQLARTPGRVYVDGSDLDGVIYLDGKLVGPSPQLITIPDTERHQIDRISPLGHQSRTYVIRPMASAHLRLDPGSDGPGNVVFSKSPELNHGDVVMEVSKDHRVSVPGRATLPPGRHRLTHGTRGCAPVAFDVPAGREVVFVYVTRAGRATAGCTPLAVTQTRVRFPK